MEIFNGSVMHLKPIEYDKTNNLQYQEAIKLMGRISNKTKKFPIVLDIGCGSGNVTKEIPFHIPGVKRILGVDIDSNMIKFASMSPASKIPTEFLVQDIAADWENLDGKLIALESQVDLVFANLALHWVAVEKREIVIQNISRFLKPGGKFLSNIIIPRPIMDLVPSSQLKEKVEADSFQKLLTPQNDIKIWRDAAFKSGLQITVNDFTKNEVEMETAERVKAILIISGNLYSSLLKSKGDEEAKQIVYDASLTAHLITGNGSSIWSYDTLKLCCIKR